MCTKFKDKTLPCIRVNMVMIVYICTLCDDITCVYCIIYRGNSPFLGTNSQLFKKFCPLYGIWGGSILWSHCSALLPLHCQLNPLHALPPAFLMCIIILPSDAYIDLPSCLISWGLLINVTYIFLSLICVPWLFVLL